MERENSVNAEIRSLLDDAYERFATSDFIKEDPIQVPRSFEKQADAEVIGFLTATIAWGQRKTILANAWKLVRLMDNAPHDLVMNADPSDMRRFNGFVHRTFNGIDLQNFILGLRHVYTTYGGMEGAFWGPEDNGNMAAAISRFKERFFTPAPGTRTSKHVADPLRGSNAKRINLFLRWMVRPNDRGVDLGLWDRISPAQLMVPLDVHTGRVGRELGLLTRKQDDWKAVEEFTRSLRLLDAKDPIKYDIALFALGEEAGRSRRGVQG